MSYQYVRPDPLLAFYLPFLLDFKKKVVLDLTQSRQSFSNASPHDVSMSDFWETRTGTKSK